MNTPPLRSSSPSPQPVVANPTRAAGENVPIQVERFEMARPDINEQAAQLADLAKGLKSGDWEAHLMIPVEASQALAEGKKLTWTLPEEERDNLSQDSLAALQDAGVEVRLYQPEVPQKVMHTKMMILDDGQILTGFGAPEEGQKGSFNFEPRDPSLLSEDFGALWNRRD